eukprot:83082_1
MLSTKTKLKPTSIKIGRSQSYDSALPVSDNEFGNDVSSRGSHSDVTDQDIHSKDIYFDRLQCIDESQLFDSLMKEPILFDSLLRVYSVDQNQYIDVAGILSKQCLYFISAINYQTWIELKERTNIDQLIAYDTIINKTSAAQLTQRLGLTDDAKIQQQINEYFVDKTIHDIKLDILCKKNKMTSLLSLLNINSDDAKTVNYVIIDDFFDENIITEDIRDQFVEQIFDGIKWTDDKNKKHAKIIKLHQYHSESIIETLNERKTAFLNKNNLNNCHINISAFDGYQIKHAHSKVSVAEIGNNAKQINIVEPTHVDGTQYGIELKLVNTDDTITCLLKSNNQRYGWITHLDFAINHDTIGEKKIDSDSPNNKTKNKLMNDFTDANDEKEEFSTHFSFGEYLNYWESGYENSVTPKYKSLKQELLKNEISPISEEDYYWLYKKCIELKKLYRYAIKAKNIGINNRKFHIKKGTDITINHLIVLKLYTDFSRTQKEFKKHCRKYNDNEPLSDLVRRNSEIAFCCKYIKESCTFFGTLMKKKHIVYTGLNKKLVFKSLTTHFEAPLSTTTEPAIAQKFCDDHGIVLKLKTANTKTRCCNVRWLSKYKEEEERLFMGSSLKICDIWIDGKWSKSYIDAMQMFEQIINGRYIVFNSKTETTLYLLIAYVLDFEDKNEYPQPPKYIITLFENIINEMKRQYNANRLWLYKNELEQIKNIKLKKLFTDSYEFFTYFNFDISKINFAKEFKWRIEDNQYKSFICMKPRQYLKSSEYKYEIKKNTFITFHMETCAKYSDESECCALFVFLDTLPINIEAIRIEYELLCCKKAKYKNTMAPQWLSKHKQYCGFKCFPSKSLKKNNSILWNLAIKILNVKSVKRQLEPQTPFNDDTEIDEFDEMRQQKNDKKIFSAVFDQKFEPYQDKIDINDWIICLNTLNVNIDEKDMSKLFEMIANDEGYMDKIDWIAFCMSSYKSKKLKQFHHSIVKCVRYAYHNSGKNKMMKKIVNRASSNNSSNNSTPTNPITPSNLFLVDENDDKIKFGISKSLPMPLGPLTSPVGDDDDQGIKLLSPYDNYDTFDGIDKSPTQLQKNDEILKQFMKLHVMKNKMNNKTLD